jgi:hypothetical protein
MKFGGLLPTQSSNNNSLAPWGHLPFTGGKSSWSAASGSLASPRLQMRDLFKEADGKRRTGASVCRGSISSTARSFGCCNTMVVMCGQPPGELEHVYVLGYKWGSGPSPTTMNSQHPTLQREGARWWHWAWWFLSTENVVWANVFHIVLGHKKSLWGVSREDLSFGVGQSWGTPSS